MILGLIAFLLSYIILGGLITAMRTPVNDPVSDRRISGKPAKVYEPDDMVWDEVFEDDL